MLYILVEFQTKTKRRNSFTNYFFIFPKYSVENLFFKKLLYYMHLNAVNFLINNINFLKLSAFTSSLVSRPKSFLRSIFRRKDFMKIMIETFSKNLQKIFK